MLPPDDLRALSRLLDEALAVAPAARAAWLAGLPVAQRHLLAPLGAMLARADGMATDPQLCSPPRLRGWRGDAGAAAHVGDLVGPYRVLAEIGRGGMGSVWLAERADGRFERRVALKLPHINWDPTLAARMARERQIDARLEHPHIARLYDAGLDPRGRPYLAFEFVDGQPIDAWCNAKRLDLPGRLRLFLQVVDAVAYAHSRLVVHRDLKPANVMVSADGQAHLLDFGIAALLDRPGASHLTADMASHATGRPLTPQYAAPEQLGAEAVTVRTDLYALGVLLYELLTGTRPYAQAHSLADLRLAQQQGDAPLASSRTTDRATRRALRGGLDAILAQCLQSDPAHRYASADALAMDIGRHLSGDAISARQEPAWRRTLRRLHRHRAAWGLASALLLGLLVEGGLAFHSVGQARRDAERAQLTTAFVGDLFKLGLHEPAGALAGAGGDAFLHGAAALIRERFPRQPEVQADLFGGVAQALLDMGAPLPAVDYAGQQLSRLQALDAPGPRQSQSRLLLGEALRDAGRLREAGEAARTVLATRGIPAALRCRARLLLAEIAYESSRYADAAAELDQADAELAREPAAPALAARAALQRASLLARTNRIDAARAMYARATALAGQEPGQPGPRLLARVQVRQALDLQKFTFDIAESKRLHALGVAALRQAGGADAVAAELAEADALYLYYANGDLKYAEADAGITAALNRLDQLGGRVPESAHARVLARHGCMAQTRGRVDLGYRELRQSAAVLERDAPESRLNLCLGFAAMLAGHADEAEAILAQHAQADRVLPPEGTLMNSKIYIALAENRMMQNQPEAARAALNLAPAYPQEQGLNGEEAVWDRQSLAVAHARLDLEAGDPTQALRQLEGISDKTFALHDSGLIRGAALCRLGQHAAGLAALQAGLTRWQDERDSDAHHPVPAYWRLVAARCAMQSDQHALAAALVQQAGAAFASQPEVAPYYKQALAPLLAALGRRRTDAARP